MSYYQCQRCLFVSKQKTGMIRHLEKKNKCIKIFSAYKYPENELYERSLIIKKNNLEPASNHTLLIQDKNQHNINNHQCKYCLKYFSTKGNLNKHTNKHENGSIPVYPIEYYQELLNNNKTESQSNKTFNTYTYQTVSNETINIQDPVYIDEQTNIPSNIHDTNNSIPLTTYSSDSNKPIHQNINQTIHNITVNQQFNSFNLFNMKYPNGFDKDWDLSKISDEKKLFLLDCCNTKYSELLKFILQNEDNLNVIIENETNTGIVYKNDIEKYIHLNKSDIIDQSLIKLNNQLNHLCQEICLKNKENPEKIEKFHYETLKMNKKFDDYKTNNNNIRNGVQNLLSDIFNEKKDKTIDIMNKIIEEETQNNLLENNGF